MNQSVAKSLLRKNNMKNNSINKENKESQNESILKEEIVSMILEYSTNYPKILEFSIFEYFIQREFNEIGLFSILDYLKKCYKSDPNHYISINNKAFENEELLVKSVKLFINSNLFIHIRKYDTLYLSICLPKAYSYLKIEISRLNKNEKFNSFNILKNNKRTISYEKDNNKSNSRDKNYIQKKRKDNLNGEIGERLNNFQIKKLTNKNNKINSKLSKKGKASISKIQDMKNIIDIHQYDNIFFSEQEFITYNLLNKELGQFYSIINVHYAQLTKLKEKVENIKGHYLELLKKRNEYNDAKKLKNELEHESLEMEKIKKTEKYSLDFIKNSHFANDIELINLHNSILKDIDICCDRNIVKIKEQNDILNQIENVMIEIKNKIKCELNIINDYYQSPDTIPLYKDIISKKLRILVNKYIKENEAIEDNALQLISFQTLDKMMSKSQEMKFQNNISSNMLAI